MSQCELHHAQLKGSLLTDFSHCTARLASYYPNKYKSHMSVDIRALWRSGLSVKSARMSKITFSSFAFSSLSMTCCTWLSCDVTLSNCQTDIQYVYAKYRVWQKNSGSDWLFYHFVCTYLLNVNRSF